MVGPSTPISSANWLWLQPGVRRAWVSTTQVAKKALNRPMAFEPPPTQATTASGRRPACSDRAAWARARN